MPNWCDNEMIIKGSRELLEEFRDKYCVKAESGSLNFSFDKVIPEPETEEECPKIYVIPKDKRKAKGDWFDWYTWRNEIWGTKCDACDSMVSDIMECVNSKDKRQYGYWMTISYQTAWCPAMGVIEELQKRYWDATNEERVWFKHLYWECGMGFAGKVEGNYPDECYEGDLDYIEFLKQEGWIEEDEYEERKSELEEDGGGEDDS